MSTKLSYDLIYEASLTEVGEMLMDPTFREEACTAQGAIRRTVTVGPKAAGMEVVVDQVQTSQGLPGFARKFVGDEINLIQTEQWSDIETATVDVVIPGKPGQMRGTIRIQESGGTTTETVEMEIRVSIPLVGGRIESLIADLLRKALKAEHVVGRDYLGR